jgi:hypothetical protein
MSRHIEAPTRIAQEETIGVPKVTQTRIRESKEPKIHTARVVRESSNWYTSGVFLLYINVRTGSNLFHVIFLGKGVGIAWCIIRIFIVPYIVQFAPVDQSGLTMSFTIYYEF